MAYRPLHIACGVLIAALSLTATMSVTTTPLRELAGGPEIPTQPTGELVPEAETFLAAAAPEPNDAAPYFPPADSRPFPAEDIVTVLSDGPSGADGSFVTLASGSGRNRSLHQPRPDHRGYEELPPPPEFSAQVATAEPAASNAAPLPTIGPIQELVTELTRLRTDLQQLGETAHGHSAVQAEMQSLRSEIAAMHERDRLDSLQQDMRRIAQRQDELESNHSEPAAKVPDPVPIPPDIQPAAPPAVDIQPVAGASGRWSARITDAEPVDVIRRLSEIGGWNLVLSRDVRGPVSLAMASATPDELLRAVLSGLDCDVREDGSTRLILPAMQAPIAVAPEQPTVAKLLRPSYIAAADLLPLVRPMLTPGIGEAAVTPDGGEDGASPARAQSDALLLVDYPQVISQVEEMLAEVDAPPEQFVIEAVITAVAWNERTQSGIVPALEQQGVCSSPLRRDRGNLRSPGCRSAQFRGNARDLLQAMQQIADARVEATPTVHVLNRQLAEVEVGANVAYREQIALGRRLRVVEEEIDFLPSRTELSIRPFLQGDDTVRLQVHPRVTHVHTDASGLPREEVAELSTDITIPLGCTAVIGGLTRSADDHHPGSVPKSGWFGRRNRTTGANFDGHETVELVVLLTPRRACDLPAAEARPAELMPLEPAAGGHAASPNGEMSELQPIDVGPQLPAAAMPSPLQPAEEPPLLERLLGKRIDSPRRVETAVPQPMPPSAAPPPPFPELPAPEAVAPQIAMSNDLGVPDALPEPELVFIMPLPAELPQTPAATAPETIQTVSVVEEVRLIPPAPADPLPAPQVTEYVVPPPPPESVPSPVSVSDPAAYIPPEPIGRAHRRQERVERHEARSETHDNRGRSNRHTATDDWVPPTPAR